MRMVLVCPPPLFHPWMAMTSAPFSSSLRPPAPVHISLPDAHARPYACVCVCVPHALALLQAEQDARVDFLLPVLIDLGVVIDDRVAAAVQVHLAAD
jgi:hypothetical protein